MGLFELLLDVFAPDVNFRPGGSASFVSEELVAVVGGTVGQGRAFRTFCLIWIVTWGDSLLAHARTPVWAERVACLAVLDRAFSPMDGRRIMVKDKGWFNHG